MELEVARKGRGDTTQLAANRRFSKFASESEGTVRKTDIKEDEILKQMRELWKTTEMPFSTGSDWISYAYEKISDNLSSFKFSAKDIENFSIAMIEFQDEVGFYAKGGLFLSALINNSDETDFIVHTRHIQVGHLGYGNTKNIIVKGDADAAGIFMTKGTITIEGNTSRYVGMALRSGTIIIKGNAGDHIGEGMLGGNIIVEGNADYYVGHSMHGGSITIKGNVGYSLGYRMNGGEIIVEGNAGESVGNSMKGGKIILEGEAGKYIGYHAEGGEIHYKGIVITGQ